MVSLGQSSMAFGLLAYIGCLVAYDVADRLLFRPTGSPTPISAKVSWRAAVLLIFIAGHSGWLFLSSPDFQLSRFIGSYFFLLVLAVGSIVYLPRLASLTMEAISTRVDRVLWFMALNALIGLTGVALFKYGSVKPIGVFSEPSHFGLALAPLLAYVSAIRSRGYQWKLAFFFAWAVWIQNLTTLLVVAACLLVSLRGRLSSVAMLFLAAFALLLIDLEYFITRLLISTESDNLSVVVLLSGWETALTMLASSSGWGGGFQQFGFLGAVGELTERVAQMTGESINRYDGGSTAAKLVGEFGVFGILGLVLVLVMSFKAFLRLRKSEQGGQSGSALFLSASLYTLPIELFARGVGYFSPTLFLGVCAALMAFGQGGLSESKASGLQLERS